MIGFLLFVLIYLCKYVEILDFLCLLEGLLISKFSMCWDLVFGGKYFIVVFLFWVGGKVGIKGILLSLDLRLLMVSFFCGLDKKLRCLCWGLSR